MKDCKECGKQYKPVSHNQAFCAAECREVYRDRERDAYMSRVMQCEFCGKEYRRKDGGAKHCSDACSKRKGRLARKARIRGSKVVESISFKYIFDRDEGRCNHCDAQLREENRGLNRALAPVLDHIIPAALGGDHAMYNMQLLCNKCNNSKQATLYKRDIEKAKLLYPESIEDYKREAERRESKLAIERAKKRSAKNASGHKGVIYDKTKGNYVVRVWANGKYHNGGRFLNIDSAVKKYRELSIELTQDEVKYGEI